MTGATLALAISHLTQGQLPVTLIERSLPDSRKHPGFDGRAIALAAGTCQQLADIDVWRSLADCGTPITDIHVSDRGHTGFVQLKADDYQVPALGQVVELFDVGQRLFQRLKSAPGVTLRCPDYVTAVERTAESVTVTLNSGEELQVHCWWLPMALVRHSPHPVASTGSGTIISSSPSLPTSPRSSRIRAVHLNVLPSTVRWRCYRCLVIAGRWCGVILLRQKRR